MAYFDGQQLNPQFNPQQWQQWALPYGQLAQTQPMGGPAMHGLGQAAYGQPFGQNGGQGFAQPHPSAWGQQGAGWGQPGWGQPGWGFGQQQRQLSQQDVGEVVRQLVPLLPHLVAQAQQQPQAAIGSGSYGQPTRLLTQQDVNEVVRQILPIIPQVVGLLQGQGPMQAAAIHGGPQGQGQWGMFQGSGSQGFGPQGFGPQGFGQQNPFAQSPMAQGTIPQMPFGYPGLAAFQSPFASPLGVGQQRQLSQQDINDVVRQLVAVIPQTIGNLQAFNQQRTI